MKKIVFSFLSFKPIITYFCYANITIKLLRSICARAPVTRRFYHFTINHTKQLIIHSPSKIQNDDNTNTLWHISFQPSLLLVYIFNLFIMYCYRTVVTNSLSTFSVICTHSIHSSLHTSLHALPIAFSLICTHSLCTTLHTLHNLSNLYTFPKHLPPPSLKPFSDLLLFFFLRR